MRSYTAKIELFLEREKGITYLHIDSDSSENRVVYITDIGPDVDLTQIDAKTMIDSYVDTIKRPLNKEWDVIEIKGVGL